MNPVKHNPNFFPPNVAELNTHNPNAHNSFLSKNQHWTQFQARFFRQNLTQLLRNQQKHRYCISLDATIQTNNPNQPSTLADTLKTNPPTPATIPQKSSTSCPTTTKPKLPNCSTQAILTKKSENSWDSNQRPK